MIDSGNYNHISIDMVMRAAEQQKVISFLKNIVEGDKDIDFSCFGEDGPYSRDLEQCNSALAGMCNAHTAADLGIRNQGLCLLLQWARSMVRQGEDW
jgi:hypothetical protein